MTAPRVQVIEDDEVIGRSLVRILTAQGYLVDWSRNAAEALIQCVWETDLVLLDLGLPDIDGLDLCQQLRAKWPALDILVVTARQDEVDIVLGLDAGADDYITKPFGLAELLARVRARLRRQSGEPERFAIGSLELDIAARRAFLDDAEIDLRPKEFDLLTLLTREAGDVVTRERIMDQVWDEHWMGPTKTLDIHISTLRRKLEGASRPMVITTLRGIGYRLERQ